MGYGYVCIPLADKPSFYTLNQCFYCFLKNKSRPFMKKSRLTWFLVASALMLTIPTTVKTNTKTKAKVTDDLTMYYWFWVDGSNVYYTWRQNRILDEADLTGLSVSNYNPWTRWEKGYMPSAVGFDESGTPVPLTPIPDASLYSHP